MTANTFEGATIFQGTSAGLKELAEDMLQAVRQKVRGEQIVMTTLDVLEPAIQEDELLLWIEAHPETVEQFHGEWVAFDGKTVVGHSRDFAALSQEMISQGREDAILYPALEPNLFV